MHIEIEIIGTKANKEIIANYIIKILKITKYIGYSYKITRENSNSITETRILVKDTYPEC